MEPPRNSPLLDACSLRNGGRAPVWIMRQAGRYLPEYRALRERHSFVEMCADPDLAVEVSLMPWRRFALDGVVVFYDILFLAEAMGAPLAFSDEGPRFLRPLRSDADLRALRSPDLRALDRSRGTGAILETIRRLRSVLPPEVAVLGFAGAPFTLASYLVGGGQHRDGEAVRRALHEDPAFVERLLDRLARETADYLRAQVEAGADAVQLFDTWASVLDPEDFRRFALPASRRILDDLRATGVPTILYVNGCAAILEDMSSSGASVLSVDWRIPLPEARRRIGGRIGLQGNLDPAALFQTPEGVRRSVAETLEGMDGDPGYIFNLGHGILPETPVASVEALVDVVRARAPADRGSPAGRDVEAT